MANNPTATLQEVSITTGPLLPGGSYTMFMSNLTYSQEL